MTETLELHNETQSCISDNQTPPSNETDELQLFTPTQTLKESNGRRIYLFLQEAIFPLQPLYMAKKLGISHNSAKSECRRLLEKGLIKQPYAGHYCGLGCNYAIHGVDILRQGVYSDIPAKYSMGVLLQNLVCICNVESCDKLPDYVFQVLDAKVRLVFGSKRRQISLYVSCANGVSVHTLSCFVTRAEAYLESSGFSPPFNWRVVNYEVLQDGIGFKIEGAEAITLQTFQGEMFKVYRKPYGARAEYRGSAPVDLKQFMSIVSGVGTNLRSAARLGAVEDHLRLLTEASKSDNRGFSELSRKVDHLTELLESKSAS